MRKFIFALLLVFAVSITARGQTPVVNLTTLTASGTSCATGSTTAGSLVVANVLSGIGTAVFVVNANSGGNTLSFYSSGDGGKTYATLSVTPSNSTTAVTTTTTTTAGSLFKASVGAYTNVCILMSTQASGNSTVGINISTASAGLGGGGGGSGTVTAGTQGEPAIYSITGATVVASNQTLDASQFSGTAWTDKVVSAYGAAACSSGCTVLVPDSIAGDGSATTPSLPSNVTVQFTGSADFTFCQITMGKFSKIYNRDSRLIMKGGGSGCSGIVHTTPATMQETDKTVLWGVRVDCQSQPASTGISFTGGSAQDWFEGVSVGHCGDSTANTAGLFLQDQFGHFSNLNLWSNYVNLKMYTTNAQPGVSSNTFYDLKMTSAGSGVSAVLTNNATGQSQLDNVFINSQCQSNTLVCMAAFGSSTVAQGGMSFTWKGAAPEVNGTAGTTVTIDGFVVKKAGAIYLNDAVASVDEVDFADANASPDILVENHSRANITSSYGFSNQFGYLVQADATSISCPYGSMSALGVIQNAVCYPNAIWDVGDSAGGAIQGVPNSYLTTDVTNTFTGNVIAPAFTSTTGTSSNALANDPIYGTVNTVTFAGSAGSSSSNRVLFANAASTSAATDNIATVNVYCSAATSLSLYMSNGGGFYTPNGIIFNCPSQQWTRALMYQRNVTSGSSMILTVYPNDTVGATVSFTRLEVATPATGSVQAAQTWAQILGGAVNPNGALVAGAPGSIQGILNLAGATSGYATLSAPAVAGTQSNQVLLSNVLRLPAGNTCAPPALAINSSSTFGIGIFGSNLLFCTTSGANSSWYDGTNTWTTVSRAEIQPGTTNFQALGDSTHTLSNVFSTAFTMGAGLADLSAGTIKIPQAPGFVSTANSTLGLDTTQTWPHFWAESPSAGGAVDKAAYLQSVSELDASSYTNGSTTCGIQEAINALPNAASAGGVVHFHGRCSTSTQITIKSSSGLPDTVTLQGDGPNASIINYSGTGTTGVIAIGGSTYDTKNVTIRDMNISCNGGTGCFGIYATRTKNLRWHHILFDNGGISDSGNTSACVVSDGGATFSAFNDAEDNRCIDGWHSGFVMKGTGANEASNNNGTYKNNEFTQLNNPAGIAYDFQTGADNTLIGGDISGYATGVHVTGRDNLIATPMEANNTTCINFDYATFSAAEYNTVDVPLLNTCSTITDNGRNNILLDPTRGTPMQTEPGMYTVVEDFDGGQNASYAIGRQNWVGSGGSANVSFITSVANHPGIAEITTTASSGTVSSLEMGNLTTVLPQGQQWEVTWVIRDNSAAAVQTKLRFGLSDGYITNPPTNGFWIENISGASATNWSCVTSNGGTQTSTAFSPSHVLDLNWHKLQMYDDGSDNITFRYDGAVECTIANLHIPTVALVPFAQSVNSENVAKLTDLDFFSMWMKTTR